MIRRPPHVAWNEIVSISWKCAIKNLTALVLEARTTVATQSKYTEKVHLQVCTLFWPRGLTASFSLLLPFTFEYVVKKCVHPRSFWGVPLFQQKVLQIFVCLYYYTQPTYLRAVTTCLSTVFWLIHLMLTELNNSIYPYQCSHEYLVSNWQKFNSIPEQLNTIGPCYQNYNFYS